MIVIAATPNTYQAFYDVEYRHLKQVYRVCNNIFPAGEQVTINILEDKHLNTECLHNKQ